MRIWLVAEDGDKERKKERKKEYDRERKEDRDKKKNKQERKCWFFVISWEYQIKT